jgi:hypothetical protein
MLAGATADRMAGEWVGYGRDFDVNHGAWTLKLVASSTGRQALEAWNKPVE